MPDKADASKFEGHVQSTKERLSADDPLSANQEALGLLGRSKSCPPLPLILVDGEMNDGPSVTSECPSPIFARTTSLDCPKNTEDLRTLDEHLVAFPMRRRNAIDFSPINIDDDESVYVDESESFDDRFSYQESESCSAAESGSFETSVFSSACVSPSTKSRIGPDEMTSYYELQQACVAAQKVAVGPALNAPPTSRRKESLTFPSAMVPSQHATAHQLQAQLKCCYAYMHGGKDLNDSPIICLPHYPLLSDVSADCFNRVIMYLTTIISACIADVGFVLLVDRRKERWPALRGTLTRIAGFFPGYLRTVLVLRPTGFLQGTMSDIGFRWKREELSMKVTMLSTLDELYSFVDPSQLTAEFGGSFEYDHQTWLNNRIVIEGFSGGAASLCESLIEYSSDLAETELPNDLKSAEDLILVQERKTASFKLQIESTFKEAVALRINTSTLGGSIIADSHHNDSDFFKTAQAEAITNFMSLIEETDMAFEKFWERHITKLKQCLQLRKFEQKYREMRISLGEYVDWFENQTHHFGGSTEWIEATISELHSRSEDALVSLSLNSAVIEMGEQLLLEDHYAVDSIGPKKDELLKISQDIRQSFELREQSLQQTLSFLVERNKWCEWCERGMKILAAQPIEKTSTAEGAEQALDDLLRFFLQESSPFSGKMKEEIRREYDAAWCSELENLFENLSQRFEEVTKLYEKRRSSLKKVTTRHGERPIQLVEPSKKSSPKASVAVTHQKAQHDDDKTTKRKSLTLHHAPVAPIAPVAPNQEANGVKRKHVMNELLHTEKVYVSELKSIVEGYGKAIDEPEIGDAVPDELLGKTDVLLGNMADILRFHGDEFLSELELYKDTPSKIGKCFISKREKFRVYCKYCQNSIKSEQLRTRVGDHHPFFLHCQRKLGHRLSLGAYLLKPIQRLTKYQLLLQQMLKHSTNDQDELKEAIKSMLEILKTVNDSMHQIAIVGYKEDLSSLGKLLMQGSFSVQVDHKKAGVKSLPRPRFSKIMQRHLFLYEKEFLFCKQQAADSIDLESSNGIQASNGNSSSGTKGQVYLFKHSLKMNAVGITENVKSDPRKLEIWYHGREEVYTIAAPTANVKHEWVREIKAALSTQPKSNTTPPSPHKPDDGKPTNKVKRSQSSKKSKLNNDKLELPNGTPKIKSSSTSSTKESLKKKASSLTRSASLGKGKGKTLKVPKTNDSFGKNKRNIAKSSSDGERLSPGPEFPIPENTAARKNIWPTDNKLLAMKDRPIISADELVLHVGDIDCVDEEKDGLVKVKHEDSVPRSYLPSISDASSYDSFSSTDFPS